jgi:hypothetical protein
MPDWLTAQIARTNGAPPRQRYARRVRCPQCLALVLKGASGDWCASDVVVDPSPLTDADEEATAVAAGRVTFALRRSGHSMKLDYRDQWQRAGSPPGKPTITVFPYVVVAEHRCKEDLPWYQG